MSKDSSSYMLQSNLSIINGFESSKCITLKKSQDFSLKLSDNQKYLLVLSKMYAGHDVCAAIYIRPDGSPFVSNNTGRRENIDKVNKILLDLDQKNVDPTATKKSLINLLKDNKVYKLSEDILSPAEISPLLIKDVDIIVDNFDRFGRDIIESKPEFIEGSGRPMHAEMKLLPYLISDHNKERSTSSAGGSAAGGLPHSAIPKEGAVSPALITSKLMCSPCDEMISIVKEQTGIDIKTVGTHGKTYPGWVPPDGIPKDMLVEMEKRISNQSQKVNGLLDKAGAEARELGVKSTVDEEGFKTVKSKSQAREDIAKISGSVASTLIKKEGYTFMVSDEPCYLSSNKDKLFSVSTDIISQSQSSTTPVISAPSRPATYSAASMASAMRTSLEQATRSMSSAHTPKTTIQSDSIGLRR